MPWSKAARQWRDRVMFLRKAEGDSWPDLSDDVHDVPALRTIGEALLGPLPARGLRP